MLLHFDCEIIILFHACIGATYDLKLGAECKPGFSPIISRWEDCKHAAEELGYSGDSVSHVDYNYDWGTSRPKGCFLDQNGRFHFNKGKGGNARGTEKILCKSSMTS